MRYRVCAHQRLGPSDVGNVCVAGHESRLGLLLVSLLLLPAILPGRPACRQMAHQRCQAAAALGTLSKKNLLSHLYWGTQWTMEIS